jgi:hypothetical protein
MPKNFMVLMSQRLAAADNMVHCFSFLPAESAGLIPVKQAHNDHLLSYTSMSREDSNCRFQKMPT